MSFDIEKVEFELGEMKDDAEKKRKIIAGMQDLIIHLEAVIQNMEKNIESMDHNIIFDKNKNQVQTGIDWFNGPFAQVLAPTVGIISEEELGSKDISVGLQGMLDEIEMEGQTLAQRYNSFRQETIKATISFKNRIPNIIKNFENQLTVLESKINYVEKNLENAKRSFNEAQEGLNGH